MNIKIILKELKHHIPFTASATLIAILFVLLFRSFDTKTAFEIIHPVHVIASAIVTSAIYYKHKKNISIAIIIGLTGSILIGSISDILLPYLGALIFNFKPEFHLPIIKETLIILSAAFIGSIIGITTKITKFPHFIHVFLSVFASLFYLISFAQIDSTGLILSFFIVFIAVLIPCCISDIIYPLFFIDNKKKTL